MVLCDAPRPRNANATRQAILEAARERFCSDSYDDVGMRDVARDVGVDAALISR
ncbi:MAG: TetR family transcriptional regulator [Brevundimonas sp.]